MRIKALFALLGLGLALLLFAGCNDSNNESVTTGTVTGTITNAATGTAPTQPVTVTLLRNGQVVKTTTSTNGTYTFTNVTTGSGYTIRVTSTATPEEFPVFNSNAFTTVTGTNTQNLTVGTGTTVGTLSGVVTNLATGTGQGNATVTLLQNGTVITTAQTGTDGSYSITNITPGSGYSLLVTSNAQPAEFADVVSNEFTIVAGANTQNVSVGTGGAGTTVSGTIGTTQPTATFTVSILQGAQTVASTTAGPAEVPTFTLSNVPAGSNYVIKVVNNTSGIVTLFGPLTVPAAGVTGVAVYTKTEEQLEQQEGVPANANVVAFISGGGKITINNNTSVMGNPTYLANVAAGTYSVTVTPNVGTPFTFTNVPVSATQPVVIRFNSAN